MQTDRPDPEATGRHRRVQVPPATETGRHRLVTAQPFRAAEPATPTPEPMRRRHAADEAPSSHPDARRRRSRTPQRVLAGATLLLITATPVLARSTSALGMHDAVAAEIAAHPDQADDTLAALTAGGALAGAASPSPAPTAPAPDDGSAARTAEPDGATTAPPSAAAPRDDHSAPGPASTHGAGPAVAGSPTDSSPSAGSSTGSTEPTPGGTGPVTTEPTGTEPTGTEPTGTEPTGAEPTRTTPTGAEPTRTTPTGAEATGTEPTDAGPPGTSALATPETTDAPSSDEPPVQSFLTQGAPPPSPTASATGTPETTVAPQPSEPAATATTPSSSATAEAPAGTIAALIERVGTLVGP